MNIKRVYSLLMLSVLLLTGCASSADDSTPDSVAETSAVAIEKSMVTLGDSISIGYGLDDPLNERYSTLLQQNLEARDQVTWHDYNYAVTGDDSSDLLKKLNNGRALHAPTADTILLYIGANNLLGAYQDYMTEKAEEKNIDLSAIASMTDEELEELQEKFTEELEDPDVIMENVQAKIDQNLTNLVSDLETIYQWIRDRNADADIYVLNIYNPYTEDVDSEMTPEETEFSDYAQTQIDRANTIISDFIGKHDDLIPVDIAAAYAASDPIPVIGTMNGTVISESTEAQDAIEAYDPHPTAEGQKLIADTVWKVMESRT